MSDEIDLANDKAQQSLDIAIRQRQDALSQQEAAKYDAGGYRICIDCDAVIPDSRVRLVNAVRCVICQHNHEQMAMGERYRGSVWL